MYGDNTEMGEGDQVYPVSFFGGGKNPSYWLRREGGREGNCFTFFLTVMVEKKGGDSP